MQFQHNYHTHTARCGHASGKDRQFVEEAIRNGFLTLGFSDHTPYPFSNGYHSTIRMDCDELDGYVSSVLSLREEFRSDIRILLGLEVEYYPAFFSEWKQMVRDYPFDYFLLGQHFVGNEGDGVYCGVYTADPAILKGYVDQTIEALQTGLFLYLAHPDLPHFSDPASPVYEQEMRRLCRAANELHIPLELNLLGIWDERWYPQPHFWRIAGEEKCTVVIGADAHNPEKLFPTDALQTAQSLLDTYGLSRLEKPL